ncbi:alpha-amylase family glycosyl hydrolase [Aliiglaciecola sp. M165]|uniref:alpha-amylase family glycosyl hydrolase n=1 Tax=Aliiglaciecola sp. M165 TaxID=2593649 RepID=UPI001181019B|nr:alpha-amylase family glycosyl hydrolase [Aliiglaciecola sp. M165]TRY33188.1 alpha-amlyase [Aliiglaciecola sp. M165]
MNKLFFYFTVIVFLSLSGCSNNSDPTAQASTAQSLETEPTGIDPFWHDATVYFMLLDRFNNGNPSNDKAYGRYKESAYLRGLHGGDLQGVINKIDEGYFSKLGVDAIWFTPVVEQIHDQDEGWGATYAYHGYWPKDWTAVDKAFGTEEELNLLIQRAREKGIKVLLDVIINHTGPVTKTDTKWPDGWVRMTPECTWDSFAGNVSCGLNSNLPDIKTESDEDTPLPKFLLDKWQEEGRLSQELAELDAFFQRTQLPRAPKNYIVKWLTDWVKEYGVDGFRVDTAKHVEPEIWSVLKQEAQYSLELWRANNPEQVTHDMPFFMVGEVMHFGVNGFKDTAKGTRNYDFGDKQVDFYNYGMDSLINMGFVEHAHMSYEELFSLYDRELQAGPLKGAGILNYVVSHDDPEPYDPDRAQPFKTANKLMLSPGAAQIYYGDEVSRPIDKIDTSDAKLRLPMDWASLESTETQQILSHWQKLGQFRQQHQALGSGRHQMLLAQPYTFARVLDDQRKVVVALEADPGKKTIRLSEVWPDGTKLLDHYSNQQTTVQNGQVSITSEYGTVLLAPQR